MFVTDKIWSLFVAAWDGHQSCKAMVAEYHPVDDDPDFPPYDAPYLRCVALDGLLSSMSKLSEDIQF